MMIARQINSQSMSEERCHLKDKEKAMNALVRD